MKYEIGRRICQYRKEQGLSQKKFAELIGASNRRLISCWEWRNHKRVRTADTAAKMTNWPEEGIPILMKRAAVYRADTAILWLRIKNPEKTFYMIEGEKTRFVCMSIYKKHPTSDQQDMGCSLISAVLYQVFPQKWSAPFQRHFAVRLCFEPSKYINIKIVQTVELSWVAKFWSHTWKNGRMVVIHRFLISYSSTSPLFSRVSGV